MSDEVKNNPVIRISVAGTVGDKCQMSLETYADSASDVKFLNALTDKLMFVRDRQVAKHELGDLKKQLQFETDQLEALKSDLQRVDIMQASRVDERIKKGIRVNSGPSEKDKTERHNIVANIEARTKRLEVMRAQIAENEKLVGELK